MVPTRRLILSTLLCVFMMLPVIANSSSSPTRLTNESDVIGIWRGQSTCVGFRPACKNEEIVYRFVEVAGRTDQVTLYADKILDGKRVPMGKLLCSYDKAKGIVSGEFTKRQTHGVWRYQITGDDLEGTLVLLPDKQIGRTVKAHRTTEDKVPEPPPLSEYEEP